MRGDEMAAAALAHLEDVHLPLHDLIVSLEDALRDDLDCDADWRVCRLPYCAPYDAEGAGRESASMMKALLRSGIRIAPL